MEPMLLRPVAAPMRGSSPFEYADVWVLPDGLTVTFLLTATGQP
jgi:hypothetical protein